MEMNKLTFAGVFFYDWPMMHTRRLKGAQRTSSEHSKHQREGRIATVQINFRFIHF